MTKPPYGRRDDRDTLKSLTKDERAIMTLWKGTNDTNLWIAAFDVARKIDRTYDRTLIDFGRLAQRGLIDITHAGTISASPSVAGSRIIDHIEQEAK